MSSYRYRLVDGLIDRKLASIGGVFLQGARSVGKTTTALQHAKSNVRLDESEQVLSLAKLNAKPLLAGAVPRLIDEWQLVPSIWNTVRREIDDRSVPGQFILAGSAAPSDDATRHTGAGRIARLVLRPMSLEESGDSQKSVRFDTLFRKGMEVGGYGGLSVEAYADLIVRGGWPALIGQKPLSAREALIDYVSNIAHVDLRTLKSPPDPVRMSALILAIARNIATEASLEKLAGEAEIHEGGVTAKTVRKYLDQLTRIFVLDELAAWRPHIRSSIRTRVKPKWHFADPSIAAAALRVTPSALLDDLKTMGFFFESLCVRDLRAYADTVDAKVFHYRDSDGLEVDAIVERFDGVWAAVEVKLGGEETIDAAAKCFARLKKRLTPKKLSALTSLNVVTAGRESYTRKDGVNVIALGHLYSGAVPS